MIQPLAPLSPTFHRAEAVPLPRLANPQGFVHKMNGGQVRRNQNPDTVGEPPSSRGIKMRIIWALSILLVSGRVSDAGPIHYSYAFGKMYASELPKEALERTPKWPEDAENPPLSARKAIKVADELRLKLVHDTEEYKWKRLSADILFVEGSDRCVWRVYYEARIQAGGGSTGRPPSLMLFVLIDGKIVQPEVSDHKNR